MIKVGDWVKIACLDNTVAKVTQIDERGVHVYIGKLMQNLYTGDFIKCLTKLPFKFKGFNVLFRTDGDREVWDCYRTVKEIGTIHFICIFDSIQFYTGYKIKYEKFIDVNLPTAEEAELWLELQYATLTAKARGMV